jgi:y4mF family transcriptional regulator
VHIGREVAVRIAATKELGRYIRDRRRELALTQVQLATSAKVSRRWLSDLETGKETADFGLVLRTLQALGVVVDLQPEERTSRVDLDALLDRYRTGPEELADVDLTATPRDSERPR